MSEFELATLGARFHPKRWNDARRLPVHADAGAPKQRRERKIGGPMDRLAQPARELQSASLKFPQA
ncbi:MAG: hypothetical protein MZW92_15405 [Comamonadaceae bacterium]|nr:hypothetical protein [Comamonadaceae bacterium]